MTDDGRYTQPADLGPPPYLAARQLALNPDDAATIREILTDVGGIEAAADELTDACQYWAACLAPDQLDVLEPGDLDTLAYLLRDCDRATLVVPKPTRDRCRYWAGYLEGRAQS
jgi:hypothetical protein